MIAELLARFREGAGERPAAALARETGLPEIVAELLLARGISTAEEASRFFRPDESQLHDPFLMRGIGEAAGVLLSAARAGRRIVVFGDYDVDGVTAVAQLKAALARAGAPALSFIPHRIRDGYGLRPDTVRRVLSELAPSVIVTVDCGITAVEGVACAREAGVDVVVTDHHLVPERLPHGAVVVNPKQPGCSYPDKNLAGTGIAFKLAEAIARLAGVSLSREALLRAACLGTIADLVPLTGENRAIAALGLAALARPKAPGLAALLEECGVERGVAPTSEEVAFRVAPRLNAAGRLDTAELALGVFEERDPATGSRIARELCARNAERQALERRVFADARERIARSFDPDRDSVIVEADPAWHRGVLGIAASRLAREYNRPVLLFALEEERASGSGRSIPGVSLHDTLKELRHRFLDFGGHDQAVGGTLAADRFEDFREEARALFAERIPRERLERREVADGELPLEEISDELTAHLERFEPHGAGNPRPVFACAGARAAEPFRPLGECGWRGRLETAHGKLDAVCWNERADIGGASAAEEPLRLHYRVSRSRWSGRPEVEIVAAWPAEAETVEPSRLPSAVSRLPAPVLP
ncbi:MAG TPA: single-stranded-DNA-specific exonuclease RecJ [Thermoanaerobaculia bacterium]|nr:single-stranded-DNA-specific exonuclease RecJ [Thermoanaerobaculia bacterium]